MGVMEANTSYQFEGPSRLPPGTGTGINLVSIARCPQGFSIIPAKLSHLFKT